MLGPEIGYGSAGRLQLRRIIHRPGDERLGRLQWPGAAESGPASGRRRGWRTHPDHVPERASQVPAGQQVAQFAARQKHLMRRAHRVSVDLGVRIIRLPATTFSTRKTTTTPPARYVDGLCRAADWAGQAGVMLALENVDATVSRSLSALHSDRAPDELGLVRIYPDMANVARLIRWTTARSAMAARRRVRIVSRRSSAGCPSAPASCPSGASLKPDAADYHGPLVVEMWADPEDSDPVATIRNARQFVETLVESAYPSAPDVKS
ncbi:MAG: hypothetical protein R2844_09080 [Caldilineales bacterium]